MTCSQLYHTAIVARAGGSRHRVSLTQGREGSHGACSRLGVRSNCRESVGWKCRLTPADLLVALLALRRTDATSASCLSQQLLQLPVRRNLSNAGIVPPPARRLQTPPHHHKGNCGRPSMSRARRLSAHLFFFTDHRLSLNGCDMASAVPLASLARCPFHSRSAYPCGKVMRNRSKEYSSSSLQGGKVMGMPGFRPKPMSHLKFYDLGLATYRGEIEE